MKLNRKSSAICQIDKKEHPIYQLVSFNSIRRSVIDLILEDYPNIDLNGYICEKDLNIYRHRHVKRLLEEEKGQLSKLDSEVFESIKSTELLAKNIEPEIEEKLTPGQKLADNIAKFGGSWTFIIWFATFLIVWMIVNSFLLITKAFDPYPFILLNLILSCLAAIQAPVIMMSQNRQETKDRNRSEHDYQVNLKAEIEIRQLHEKIDHIILHQNQKLLEIQEIQMELLEQIVKGSK